MKLVSTGHSIEPPKKKSNPYSDSLLGRAGVAAPGGISTNTSGGPDDRGSLPNVARPVVAPPPIQTVSTKDYAPTGKAKTGGGSGSKSKAATENDYQREIEQIKERTAAIQAETAAQAGVNPLINDYGLAVETASAKQDLLNAAHQAGITITPTVAANIDALANSYAQASVAADKLKESQDKARDSAREMNELAKDTLSGFVSDLRSGVGATDALGNALDKIADKLLSGAFDMLFSGMGMGGMGGGAGLLGGIASIFGFAKGGIASKGKPLPAFAGGGVSRSAAIFGEAGPEAAVPLPDGRQIPVDLRMPAAGSGGRGGNRTFHIDARGAQQGVGEEIRKAITAYDRELDRTIGAKFNKGRRMNRAGF